MSRGGGRYAELGALLYMDPTKNVGGAKRCTLSIFPKVGGAIAPPVPPSLMSTKYITLPL